ncbi:hypothetical protein C8R43DRAFT_886247 [Mycena crocata]|nr:hypothetical protein C8R43DRAFT_886247 [Mycena crocata]
MEPILPVYAAPWAPPLPVTTVILPKEHALQALEVALGDERRKGATWFTDGSLLEGRAGGAAVRVEDGREKERLVVPLGESEVCDGEMEGLVCSTSRSLKSGCACILCVADSQAALRGITSTKLRSGQYRAILYDKLVRGALRLYPHLTIVNMWTPAHIGTVGNELADAAAKEATLTEPDPALYASLTTVRRRIHLFSIQQWEKRWTLTKTGKALRTVDNSPVSLCPKALYSTPSIPRRVSSIISQLRTSFTFLNADCFKSGFIESPVCDACGAPYETRAHYVLECPAWEHLRQPLHAVSWSAGLTGSLHLGPLLSHPKILKEMGKFIEATGRFS